MTLFHLLSVFKYQPKPHVLVNSRNLNTQKPETRSQQATDQPVLQRELRASLDCIVRPYLKKAKLGKWMNKYQPKRSKCFFLLNPGYHSSFFFLLFLSLCFLPSWFYSYSFLLSSPPLICPFPFFLISPSLSHLYLPPFLPSTLPFPSSPAKILIYTQISDNRNA